MTPGVTKPPGIISIAGGFTMLGVFGPTFSVTNQTGVFGPDFLVARQAHHPRRF